MLPKPLPTHSKEAHCNDPQTNEEWEEYFADRRKLDKPVSMKDQYAIANKMLVTNMPSTLSSFRAITK
ncbi:MAG: hypothetical protein IAB19_02005 [Proteobacteria bacterium]|uniref:Uncharacterized protein n=1 Tax=Candidatus Avisuccinivibrio stercorigallinarum TaxID=2840704 RepID=A0A9D9DB64_9GAMM|nr:hypothetical protein [Candidatus Avisuccinivibrio stercorigallinarum]